MYGTIKEATGLHAWSVTLDYDDSTVTLTTAQLKDMSTTEGSCVVVEDDVDDTPEHDDESTEPAETAAEAAEAPDVAEDVEVGGVTWHYVPGLEIAEDASRLASKPKAVITGITFSAGMDLDAGFWKFFPYTPTYIAEKISVALKEIRRREATEKEVVTWFALFIGASLYDEMGEDLWKQGVSEGRKKRTGCPDFSRHMKWGRWRDIRRVILTPFTDETATWKLDPLIAAFNAHRAGLIRNGVIKVNDESMSAFRPRTTKSANLPKLSHLPRKPEPLGTELKTMADAATKIMQYLEIQKRPAEMAELAYHREHGATVSCSMRLTANQPDNEDWVVLQDAWFGGFKNTSALWNRRIGKAGQTYCTSIVKTNHSRFPKQWILNKMAKKKRGTHVALWALNPDTNICFLAIGYKYNQKKTVLAITSRGLTTPGVPYCAHHPDQYGNLIPRYVPRLEIMSTYFSKCDVIDNHNAQRQKDLALEKKWITQDGFFRIFTTVVGICVVDFWNGFRYSVKTSWKQREFTDYLVEEMLNHGGSRAVAEENEPFEAALEHKVSRIGTRKRTATEASRTRQEGEEYPTCVLKRPYA